MKPSNVYKDTRGGDESAVRMEVEKVQLYYIYNPRPGSESAAQGGLPGG